jgi:hypothetical protein
VNGVPSLPAQPRRFKADVHDVIFRPDWFFQAGFLFREPGGDTYETLVFW